MYLKVLKRSVPINNFGQQAASLATQATSPRRVRVGIDVGGTFTDVVVLDHETRNVIAQLKVPTTHSAPEGVARGIISAIESVLADVRIHADEVVFIAHSTTQATNALLEGDVARVAVIGIGRGLGAWKARRDTRVPPVKLGAEQWLKPDHYFIKCANGLSESVIDRVIAQLHAAGGEVVVASEAFGVDHPANENRITDLARQSGIMATSGHEVSSLYGLRTRTRTAVLNAAILPKMVETAEMTARCVRDAGIRAPLMIMRSDGGVMSLSEVHRRPITTMLSGPAAGIAGALLHERVSDGIFIEVGGTSADISVIRDGAPQTRSAQIGGHRTFLNTLDVRTLGIAGGSMVREAGGTVIDVGPRSAHITGLGYACFASANQFADADQFADARIVHIRPTPRDPDDYVAIESKAGTRLALTPTCAANVLGLVPEGSFAKGSATAARAAFLLLGKQLGITSEEAANRILHVSCVKIKKQVEELISDYRLDRSTLELIGGGGGAASLVPYSANLLGLPFRIARKAEVISTIGVALAMVRDTVERNIVDPSREDILRTRREATDSVIRAGALPETVEVHVEVDTRRHIVRATAFGTTQFKQGAAPGAILDVEECRRVAAHSMHVSPEQVTLLAETDGARVFAAVRESRGMFGFFTTKTQMVRVTDRTGVICLQRSSADVFPSSAAGISRDLERIIFRLSEFGDAGKMMPDLSVLVAARIVNLSGLADAEQVVALANAELESVPQNEKLVLIASSKNA
ncbi:MAG TPA: hydantoinase/oxoprolinase family protein [Candidatus Dormibacteraeota bacterium]|nr:hydantoinase/oxoprolinase family protein [Candidatus Dormibacteraeota bacterium]